MKKLTYLVFYSTVNDIRITDRAASVVGYLRSRYFLVRKYNMKELTFWFFYSTINDIQIFRWR